MSGQVQSRYWACIGYSESLFQDWLDILKSLSVPVVISPIHDKDLEKDGVTYKKAHYHILADFGSQRRKNTAQSFFDKLGVMPSCINVLHPGNYYHYLWHDQQTDKALYSEDDIINIANFVPPKIKDVNQSSTYMMQIFNIIRDDNIKSYKQLLSVLFQDGLLDIADFCISKPYAINLLFRGHNNEKNIPDGFKPVPNAIYYTDDFPF